MKRGIILGSGYNYVCTPGYFCVSVLETTLEYWCTNELPF